MQFKTLTAILAGTTLLMACSDNSDTEAMEDEAAVETMAEAVDYSAILAAEDRSVEDKDRDSIRKPADVLAKVGLSAGDTVVDVGAGSGYYTEVFSRTVGADGTVYAVNNPGTLERFPQIVPALTARAEATPATVVMIDADYQDIEAYNADLVFMGQMYHEVVRQNMDAAAINMAIFNTLKPGGYYVIEIHNAAEGAGRGVSEELHRTDPAIVRTEVLAAGFTLVEEDTELLGNADDPLDILIFGEGIRGKTARTIFVFQKSE